MRVRFSEHPIVQTGARHIISKQGLHVPLVQAVDKPFFRFQASKDAVDPKTVALGSLKFPSAEVEQREILQLWESNAGRQ